MRELLKEELVTVSGGHDTDAIAQLEERVASLEVAGTAGLVGGFIGGALCTSVGVGAIGAGGCALAGAYLLGELAANSSFHDFDHNSAGFTPNTVYHAADEFWDVPHIWEQMLPHIGGGSGG